jgi:antitoxin component of MazEF toxin-antitoxin module
MATKLTKHGNSSALVIDRPVLDRLRVEVGLHSESAPMGSG